MLHIEKRPKTLDEVVGNDGIKESIKSVFMRDDKPHVVMMKGPKGSGKTTIARIIATMVGCSLDDINEINCAQNNGIDMVREIQVNAQYSPNSGDVKVYILDEAHALTAGKQGAQNALLKILEDTPPHVFFIICTTDPEMLLPAFASRCMQFEVKSLATPQMNRLLYEVLESEGIAKEEFSAAVIKEIVKVAEGSPRQALIVLDSVIDILDEKTALAAISDATMTEQDSKELCREILSDRKGRWDSCRFLLKGISSEPEKTRRGILRYMNTVLMSDNCADPDRVVEIIDCLSENCFDSGIAGLHAAVFRACKA